MFFFFFFSSRRRHTRSLCDWSSDVCSSDLDAPPREPQADRRGTASEADGPAALRRRDARSGQAGPRGQVTELGGLLAALVDARVAFIVVGGVEIGRASCRERVGVWVDEGGV